MLKVFKCKEHDFDEIFMGSETEHKPIKVCGKCKMGFSIKEDKWYIPKELDKLKAKIRCMSDRPSRGR